MYLWLQQFRNRHDTRALLTIGAGIICFVAIITTLGLYKYASFAYDAIDLGIYSQVFYNSAHGDLFSFSIHPHNYLGDHFELFILALLPMYRLFQHPVALIVLQAIGLGLGAWPLYLIARRWLPRHWSLGITGAYLLNPVVWNMALFEFHILPFAIPLILAMYYTYLTNRLGWFWVWSLVALTIREDVSLVLMGFGILGLIEKRRWTWALPPLLAGGVWLIGATHLSGYFNGSDTYKFIALYSWLGDSLPDMITTVLTRPWVVLLHLLRPDNWLLMLGLSLPLAGLPLLRWKYWIPTSFITVQLFLTSISATIVLQTHYAALLIPSVCVAAIAVLQPIAAGIPIRHRVLNRLAHYRQWVAIVGSVAVIYSFVTFSPASALFSRPSYTAEIPATISEKNVILGALPEKAAVVSGFDTLAELSSRTKLYSLHYGFLGVRQFSATPYAIPSPVDHVIMDTTDFVIFQLQSQTISSYHAQYTTGAERLRKLVADNNLHIAKIMDSVVWFSAAAARPITPVATDALPGADAIILDAPIDEALSLVAWERLPSEQVVPETTIVPIQLSWYTNQPVTTDYTLALTVRSDAGALVYKKFYPVGYGLWPTSSWQPQRPVQSSYWFALPDTVLKPRYTVSLQVVSLTGYMTLDALRSTQMHISSERSFGPSIQIVAE